MLYCKDLVKKEIFNECGCFLEFWFCGGLLGFRNYMYTFSRSKKIETTGGFSVRLLQMYFSSLIS